jgi:hypothetical protein
MSRFTLQYQLEKLGGALLIALYLMAGSAVYNFFVPQPSQIEVQYNKN